LSEPAVELRLDADGTLDDVVIRTPTLVRLERMDRGQWWMRVDVAGEASVVFQFWSGAEIRVEAEREETTT